MRGVADANRPVCYVTTVGRRSGRRHRVEIWYLERGDCLYLLSGYGQKADWVRNLLARPQVTVEMPPHPVSAAPVGNRTYVADLGPLDDELAIRQGMDARYHDWSADRPLSEWAATSLIVQLRPA